MPKIQRKKKKRYPTHMSFDRGLGLNPVYAKYGGWLDKLEYQHGGSIPNPEKLKEDEITGNAVPIKSAIAYGSAFGNPAVERMVKPVVNPYIFKGDEPYTTPDMKGEHGTHYMFSQDNYAIPMIQQGLNGLFFNENASPSDKEAIKFRTDEEAERFAKRYKEFAPAFKYKYKKGGWLNKLKYENGGGIEDPTITVDLPTVAISAQGNQYPYYGKLNEEEQRFFNEDNPIGRAMRAKAHKGYTPNADEIYRASVKDFVGIPVVNGLQTFQIPQSLLVEGIEGIRGNEYNFRNAFPNYGYYKTNQRSPSDTFLKNANPIIQFAGDMFIDLPTPYLAGKGLKLLSKTKYGRHLEDLAKNLANDVKKSMYYLDDSYVLPIQYRKEIKKLKQQKLDSESFWKSQEGKKRLQLLNIDSDNLEPYNLSFSKHSFGRYNTINNTINIDFGQLKKLKKMGYDLSPSTVLAHEEGHYLQREAYRLNDYLEDLKKYEINKEANLKNQLLHDYLNNLEPYITLRPTEIDEILTKIKPIEKVKENIISKPKVIWGVPEESLDYFNDYTNVERFPYLREMRQNMLNKKAINNINEYISRQKILDFIEKTPGDRISSFVEKNPYNLDLLNTLLNNVPSLIPAIGLTKIGTDSLNQKRHGGWLDNL